MKALNIITQGNYVIVLTISIIFVLGLLGAATLFVKNRVKIGAAATCIALLFAVVICVLAIKTSIPFIQGDIYADITDNTNNMLDDYAIDSSSVDLNFNY